MSATGGNYRGNPRTGPPGRGATPSFPPTPSGSGIPVPAPSPGGPSHSEAGSSVSDSRKRQSKRDEVFSRIIPPPHRYLVNIAIFTFRRRPTITTRSFTRYTNNLVFTHTYRLSAAKSKMISTKRNIRCHALVRLVRLPRGPLWPFAHPRLCR